MFTFSIPFFSLVVLLLNTTTNAQPYTATDHVLLDCGSSTASTSGSNQRWDGDQVSKFVPSNITTTSFSSETTLQDPSVPTVPYSTVRIINTSLFTYRFPVSEGPKFLRLYFYPATYSGLTPNQSFFSVSANGYSLLTNFSAFLTALFLAKTRSDAGVDGPPVPHFVKEFLIYVKDTQYLNVVFTPVPNSYAFINGIEIVSMPDNLYFDAKNPKPVGMSNGPVINDDTALENVYRLNMGGQEITGNDDTGMFRSWDMDDNYIYGAAIGLTPLYHNRITYTEGTPNYTAPEPVYQTQRSMGKQSKLYNLTWILPVDSGFFYMLRLHLCNIIPQYTEQGQTVFTVFINNQTAELEVDLLLWTPGSGYPVIKDYIVFVNPPDSRKSKQDLWLALHPYSETEKYADGYLNGLEVFKMSLGRNLAGPNPELSSTSPQTPPAKRTEKKTPYAAIIGGIGGGLFLLSILVLIVLRRRRRVKHLGTAEDHSSYGPAYSESKSTKSYHSTLPSDRCRRFLLTDVKAATNEFSDDCVIGHGGFGKVYKGYIDDVAIKRLNPSSNQGVYEFHTEIGLLSKLRHVQLVSLIGYSDDEGEMILVYDYMAHGTLREHLYRTSNPPLSWKTRLDICIGAAKGLHYLHTGAKRAIIHRDVKSTNILLDENWVAKVSDFGLSKLGPRDQAQNHVSTVVKGTFGYMDPEYFNSKQLTDKSDVYSFGVVLLEVLCARPAINRGLPYEQINLAEWGKFHYRKGNLHEIIDSNLSGVISPKCLMKFGELAHNCLKKDGSERPSMEEVVWQLEFALQLQEDAEKTGDMVGVAISENQELSYLMQEEPTTTDKYALFGLTGVAIMRGKSTTDSTNKAFDSGTTFTQMLPPTGGQLK